MNLPSFLNLSDNVIIKLIFVIAESIRTSKWETFLILYLYLIDLNFPKTILEFLIPVLIVLIGEIIIFIYIVRKIKISGFKEEKNKIGLSGIGITIFIFILLSFLNFFVVFKQTNEIYTLLYIVYLILSSIILSIEIYLIIIKK